MSTSLPSPPFIDVSGVANFRDAGGNDLIRKSLLFRAADPSRAEVQGLQKMAHELGIKVVYDLRSTPEIRRDGPEWAGVEVDQENPYEGYGMKRRWVPVFAAQDYGPEQVGLRYKHYTRSGSEGFVKAYHDILLAAPAAYSEILRHLAQAEPEPCLVHCTAGKDRTGVLVALIFMLVGVGKEEIGQEYSLTDLGLADKKPIFIERLLKNPALGGNREGVQNMVSSKKENMLSTVEMIEKEFGGAERYMKEYCKLSDEEIGQLKKNLRQS